MRKPFKLKRAEDYYIKTLLKEVKLKEIMTDEVISAEVSAPFSEVAEKLTRRGIRHLPIIDDEKKLVGIMTERDLFKIQPPRKLEEGGWYYDKEMLDAVILEDVMIKAPFCMHPDDSIGEALLQMVRNKYGCIPIVDKKNVLCGIVTQIDILQLAAQIYSE